MLLKIGQFVCNDILIVDVFDLHVLTQRSNNSDNNTHRGKLGNETRAVPFGPYLVKILKINRKVVKSDKVLTILRNKCVSQKK